VQDPIRNVCNKRGMFTEIFTVIWEMGAIGKALGKVENATNCALSQQQLLPIHYFIPESKEFLFQPKQKYSLKMQHFLEIKFKTNCQIKTLGFNFFLLL
jgi:hypothetical protein